MERPRWGNDHEHVRSLWGLDPTIDHLNHGSFGACPHLVLEKQNEWRVRMESDLVEFLYRRLPGLLREARTEVASFLRADPDELVFVPNATTAVSTVLSSLLLEAGDELLTTDHAYPAVLDAMRAVCARTGTVPVTAQIPLPLPGADDIVARIDGAITDRTRLLIVDHITSSTGLIFPVGEIVRAAHARGVPVLIDGAHAPGQLDADVGALDADFWTGNFHKWCCAPKGAAAFVVKREHHDRVRPLVTSHSFYEGWDEPFGWTGTYEPTAYLTVPAAIAFMASFGWDRVRTYNHALVAYGRALLADALDAQQVVPDEAFASMALVPLPEGTVDSVHDGLQLSGRLHDEHRVEVPFTYWGGRGYVRISAQIYNSAEQYERLACLLPALLR